MIEKSDAMFIYHIINEDKFTTVLPEGEMAFDVCRELDSRVSELMEPGVFLSFNMEKVTFIDCAGVGFLVKMKNLTEKQNGLFEIRRLQKNVGWALDILALNKFLNVSIDAVAE